MEYKSKNSHYAVCGNKSVSCKYPSLLGGEPELVALSRTDGFFQCVRCFKRLKKDQAMKASRSTPILNNISGHFTVTRRTVLRTQGTCSGRRSTNSDPRVGILERRTRDL
jgi:hypothetical protein